MRRVITSNIAALAVVMALPSVAVAGDPAPSGAEREFAGLLNQERARQGLPALATSPALTDVGDDYVAENVARGGITHDRDRPFTARAEQAGCTGWSGPVLGEGYANPAQALKGWLDSPDHRAILLDPKSTHVGAGFKGQQALAFVLHCASDDNAGEILGNSVTGGLGGAFRMSSKRPRARGRTISTRVRIRAGKGRVGLVARSGRRTMRGRRVAVVKRARPYRLAVRVSRPGRWKVSLRVNGRITRSFTVRVKARR